MADTNDSLNNIVLDLNENLSNSDTLFNTNELLESVPPKSSFECDLTFNSLEPSNNDIEMPEDLSEICSNKVDASQNIEVDTNKRNSDSGIHDSQNNIVDNTKLIDFTDIDLNLSNNCGVISDFNFEENDVQLKDEEFHDAVQFFKDPSSMLILESAGTSSAPTEPLIARSSLYVNFDPLHAKFYSQFSKPKELEEIAENKSLMSTDNLEKNDIFPAVENKHLANVSPRESLGNILISFDSPVVAKNSEPPSIEEKELCEPQKLYTEEELQQALKIQELSIQDTFLKKHQELESKLNVEMCISKKFHSVLEEFVVISSNLSDGKRVLQEKLEITEKENNKLKEDLKTSVEDLQSVESTFSDFHKRYEQCKSMLKVYTQNETQMQAQLENMKIQLQEKEEMFKILQSRTEETLDKANAEVSNAKKASDAQVAVLKAQLQKAELKISSLESDVKHVKIENSKLSSICDELMAKVSET